jgi:hypothetical protein
VITTKEFFTGQVDAKTKGIKVSGFVKNVGQEDARNIVVQVTCGACSEEPKDAKWFTSLDKASQTIDYLEAGQKARFEITFARITGAPQELSNVSPPEEISISVNAAGNP